MVLFLSSYSGNNFLIYHLEWFNTFINPHIIKQKVIFIPIPIIHCGRLQMGNGCFSADSEFKLKDSISTSQSNYGGKDLKTDRTTVISPLLLLGLLLVCRGNKWTNHRNITPEKRTETWHMDGKEAAPWRQCYGNDWCSILPARNS